MTAAILQMRPMDVPRSWDDFRSFSPPYSIAIDGYVDAPPSFDPAGPWANFDHHLGVDRLATRATCAQVLLALRLGLIDAYSRGGEFLRHVYMNDCDPDVCLAVFLLKYPEMAVSSLNPALNRLIHMSDLFDATGGTYPFPPDQREKEEQAWLFQPYWNFRMSGELDRREEISFRAVLSDVEQRIHEYLAGRSQRLKLDTRFKIIGGGRRWKMIKEIGADARAGMFAEGIRAFVSVRERPDGRWVYTLGRTSPYVTWFDVPRLLTRMNEYEGTTDDRWGGGDMYGGSPRVSGSPTNPKAAEAIIEEEVEKVAA